MNHVTYGSLVQAYDADFESNFQQFAQSLARHLKHSILNITGREENIFYLPLNPFRSEADAERLTQFAGKRAALAPFNQWLNPNEMRGKYEGEDAIRYFHRRMGIIGRLVERILNTSFVATSSDGFASLRCRAVYIGSTQQMGRLYSMLKGTCDIYMVNPDEAKESFYELSKAPKSTDRDLSLRIEMNCEDILVKPFDEKPLPSMPEAEGGESPFILQYRKGETAEKIKRIQHLLQEKHAQLLSETIETGVCIALVMLTMCVFISIMHIGSKS